MGEALASCVGEAKAGEALPGSNGIRTSTCVAIVVLAILTAAAAGGRAVVLGKPSNALVSAIAAGGFCWVCSPWQGGVGPRLRLAVAVGIALAVLCAQSATTCLPLTLLVLMAVAASAAETYQPAARLGVLMAATACMLTTIDALVFASREGTMASALGQIVRVASACDTGLTKEWFPRDILTGIACGVFFTLASTTRRGARAWLRGSCWAVIGVTITAIGSLVPLVVGLRVGGPAAPDVLWYLLAPRHVGWLIGSITLWMCLTRCSPMQHSAMAVWERAGRHAWWIGTVVLSCGILLGWAMPSSMPVMGPRQRILILAGPESHASEATPPPGIDHSGYSGFHWLPEYLRFMGHSVHVVTRLPAEHQSTYGVVIVPWLATLRSEWVSWLLEFARTGGRVVLVAEHTLCPDTRENFNGVCTAAGIRIRFDTNYPLPRSSQMGIRWTLDEDRMVSAWRKAGWHTRLRWGAGCTLETDGKARPLVVADRAFSDIGDIHNADPRGGYLGDRELGPGEAVGTFTLAAVGRLGQGIVVVAGDSTAFQNTALQQTLPFVDCLVAGALLPRSIAWHPLVAGVILAGAYLTCWRAAGMWLSGTLILATTGVAAGTWVKCHTADATASWAPRSDARVAVVQSSHFERVSVAPDGVGAGTALAAEFMRSGLLPVMGDATRLATRLSPHTVVVTSPWYPYDRREVGALLALARDGARILVTAGHWEAGQVQPFLDAIEAWLVPVPLGGGVVLVNGQHRIQLREAWGTACRRPALVNASLHGFPVVLSSPIGKGNMVFVADPQFLWDLNLETTEAYCPQNLAFVRAIVKGPS